MRMAAATRAQQLGHFRANDAVRVAAISGVAVLPVPMAHTGS
jgi:hypothetical protein